MHRFRLKPLTASVALLLLLAAPAAAEVISKVAAVVNDTIITTHQLDKKVVEASAEEPAAANLDAAGKAKFRREVLDRMVDDELVRQRAAELKLTAGDDEVDAAIADVQEQNKLTRLQLIAALEQQGMTFDAYRSNMRDQITRYKLLGREVQSKIDVTGQEVQTYYEQHLDDYRSAPYVHLSDLVFALPKDATDGEIEAQRAKADKARKRLLDGDSVADLLITYADAASGGDMGKLSENDLAGDFAAAIADLPTGGVSPVVRTAGGFYLFKMEQRSSGDPQPLEAVRDAIEKILLEKNREQAFDAWKKGLHDAAYIDVRI